ncbi:MAG: SDR family NAD(P)-dependent oxidoreductase [Cyanophyceae cyanobacterium]
MTQDSTSSRVALVSGVSRAEGIGFEVCRQLADWDITVFLTSRRLESAERLAAQLTAEDPNRDVRAAVLDVSDVDTVTKLAVHIEQTFGKLDILINNAAGIAPYGEKAASAALGVAQEVMGVTLFGAWRMCQVFLPLLRKSPGGRIVNVSSGAGSHADPVFGLTTDNSMGTSYAVAKAALNALTVKLAREETDSGVLINAVCPGFTATFPGAEAMGARPVAEGASGIVWAALLSEGGPSGGFFRDGKLLPW